MQLRTSLHILSTPNRAHTEKAKALSHTLEHGTEEDYLELLVGWGVPAYNLQRLLNEFRHYRRQKRGLL